MPRTATVVRTERPTPHVVRVVLAGADLDELPVGEFTDHYVKLLLPDPASGAAEVKRAYTVRAFDAATSELTLDVVVHGGGVAAPWAEALSIGDEVSMLGPGGAWAPSADVAWHLLVGDESALPAIAVALERLPAGRRAIVVAEVEDAAEQVPLPSPGEVEVRWLHRAEGTPGEALVEAVVQCVASEPSEDYDAFVHGEAGFVRDVRRHLRARGLPRERLSASGYWRRGRNDEAWRAEKKAWNAEVEAEDQASGG